MSLQDEARATIANGEHPSADLICALADKLDEAGLDRDLFAAINRAGDEGVLARAEKAEAAIERVRAIHTPLTVYTEICDYSDTDCKRPHVEDRDGDEYHLDGPTKQVCAVCSEDEEYSPGTIPWPCPTLQAIGGE